MAQDTINEHGVPLSQALNFWTVAEVRLAVGTPAADEALAGFPQNDPLGEHWMSLTNDVQAEIAIAWAGRGQEDG